MLFPTVQEIQAVAVTLMICIDAILSVSTAQLPYILSDHKILDTPDYSRQKRDLSGQYIYTAQRDVLLHLDVIDTKSPIKTPDPETPMSFWRLADDKFTKRQQFADYSQNGTITLRRSGFYLIMADIIIENPTKKKNWYWYTIRINGRTFLRCERSDDFWTSRVLGCRTSAGVYLHRGQNVTIHSKQEGKEVNKGSFWGLVRIKKGRGILKERFGYND